MWIFNLSSTPYSPTLPPYHSRTCFQPTQGAYYYHYSATDGWPTPEDALKAVKEDTDARGIPVRYAQWDDWWYSQKGGDVGGLLEWQPRKAVFPSGLTDWLAPWKTSLYVAMYSPGNIFNT